MANPVFPDVGRNDSIEQMREIVGEVNQLLNWLFQGNIDSLNIRRLTADKINTGTLDAGKVTVNSNLNAGAYIRIDGNGMVINDGAKDVFKADINGHVTMTGATVQTAAGTYPRIELASIGNLLTAYLNGSDYLAISPDAIGGTPTLYFNEGGFLRGSLSMIVGDLSMLTTGTADINIGSSNDLNLYSGFGNYVYFNKWDEVRNKATGNTLQQDLNSLQTQINGKANTFSGFTGTFFVSSTLGGAADQEVTVTNGIVTNVV